MTHVKRLYKNNDSADEKMLITTYCIWLGLILYVPVNSYGHVGMVSSLNHTFFLSKLDLTVNQYFVHILLLVTDNNPSLIRGSEENGRRNHFWINFHESMGLGQDQTPDPWICS